MTIYVHGRVLYSVKKVTSNQSYHKLCRLWPHWSISKQNYAVHYRQSTHDSNLFLVIGSFVSRGVYKYMYHRVRWQISFTTYTASSSRAHVPETDTPSKPRERQREGKRKKKNEPEGSGSGHLVTAFFGHCSTTRGYNKCTSVRYHQQTCCSHDRTDRKVFRQSFKWCQSAGMQVSFHTATERWLPVTGSFLFICSFVFK